MRASRGGTLLALIASCVLIGSTSAPPSAPSPTGAEVGFWAHLDAASFTPEVFDALASAGGAVYLRLDYMTAFGPPGSGVSSALAVDVIREANQRGIPVNAWVVASIEGGIFGTRTTPHSCARRSKRCRCGLPSAASRSAR